MGVRWGCHAAGHGCLADRCLDAGTRPRPPPASVRLDRNDPVFALDARLGHIRGCYVDEAEGVSDLLINDEVPHQLSLVGIRTVDELSPHQVRLRGRVSEMGEMLKPPQAFINGWSYAATRNASPTAASATRSRATATGGRTGRGRAA